MAYTNVALEPDRTAPFGTCPAVAKTVTIDVSHIDTGGNLVQITGGYRLGGATHALYRVFGPGPAVTYGLADLGGGVGRWSQSAMAIVLASNQPVLQWGPDLSLGDAMLPAGDGVHEYVWGCPVSSTDPSGRSCLLARLDADDVVELWFAPAGPKTLGTGVQSTEASYSTLFFDSGPWISSIVPAASGLMHVFDGAFGTAVSSQVASGATAPWADGPDLAPCDLPSDDPGAYCAGAVVHPELADPTRPNELVVSYSIGTTSSDPPTANYRDRYWPRLVWVQR